LITSFFNGFGTGFVLSTMLGTVFFYLIQNSIDNGFKSGIAIALGVILSDVILIYLSTLNAYLIPHGGTTEIIVRITGACLLIFIGLYSIFKKKVATFYPKTKKMTVPMYMVNGFVLNAINPANFFMWVGISTTLQNSDNYSPTRMIIYFSGTLLAIFLTEILISYSASKLKRFLDERAMTIVNVVSGIAFLIFAGVVLWPVVNG
jgi:threonine/homoserine/homoserine lactone efflux protein